MLQSRRERPVDIRFGPGGDLDVLVQAPVFTVLEASARRHVAQFSQRLHLQKLFVGEGFVGSPKVRMPARLTSSGSLYKQVGPEKIRSQRIAIEQSGFLCVRILGFLPEQ